MGINKKHYQIVIIGGGMVGLSCAIALAQQSITVAIIENHLPLLNWDIDDYSARVSAINAASVRWLEKISVWKDLRTQTFAPLRCLRVWDDLAGAEINFDSANLGKRELGFIVENREIVRALWEKASRMECIDLYCPQKPIEIKQTKAHCHVILANKTEINAELTVGADGSHSWLRQQLRIDLQKRPYDHDAIVAVIQTAKPHRDTAYQVFLPDGILAALPLHNKKHAAIVWSTSTNNAASLLAANNTTFALQLTNAFANKLGDIEMCSSRQSFPLVMRHVCHYVRPRFALMGDAAHTIHPLAGQGLNLGFMDAACLTQCLLAGYKKRNDLGDLRALRRYERWRKADNSIMLAAMRLFKETFASQSLMMVQLRAMGLQATDKMSFIKNYIMRYAMGDL